MLRWYAVIKIKVLLPRSRKVKQNENLTVCPVQDLTGWMVGFGLNGPVRQYFSLYQAVSQREREKGKRNDRLRDKCPNNPNLHLLQAQ